MAIKLNAHNKTTTSTFTAINNCVERIHMDRKMNRCALCVGPKWSTSVKCSENIELILPLRCELHLANFKNGSYSMLTIPKWKLFNANMVSAKFSLWLLWIREIESGCRATETIWIAVANANLLRNLQTLCTRYAHTIEIVWAKKSPCFIKSNRWDEEKKFNWNNCVRTHEKKSAEQIHLFIPLPVVVIWYLVIWLYLASSANTRMCMTHSTASATPLWTAGILIFVWHSNAHKLRFLYRSCFMQHTVSHNKIGQWSKLSVIHAKHDQCRRSRPKPIIIYKAGHLIYVFMNTYSFIQSKMSHVFAYIKGICARVKRNGKR